MPPADDQFSLDFVNADRDVIDDRLQNYDEVTETRVRSYDLDETVYVIYTKTNEVTEAEKVEYEFGEAFAEMDPDTRIIVSYFLDVFSGVQERKYEEEGVPLDAYKDVEIERIPDAFQQVDWIGTIPEIGGQLTSNFILCHALPNANHRTSFSMFEGYVNAAVRPTFELPTMVTEDYEWQTWVDEFIVESERLLTVRRNAGPFRHLSQHGCTTIRRKGGIEVPFADYDLSMRPYDALSEYARRHEELTASFTETILRRTGRENLVTEPGIDQTGFADYIRSKI